MGNLLRERAFLPYNLLMRKGLLFLVAAGFLMGAYSFYDWSQAADCTINSLNWQKDSAVLMVMGVRMPGLVLISTKPTP